MGQEIGKYHLGIGQFSNI